MENIKWLWGVMDKRYHKWHILGLIISAVTSLMLLINPYLTMRLMDDVIVAQNPEPLVGLLLTMLIVKVVREGLRYLMVVLLEHSSQNTLMNLRTRLFARLQYQDMRFFDIHRTGDLMTRLSADTDWCRHFLAYIDYVAVDSVVMFVSSSIYLFSVNWKLALAMVCVTPLLMIITKVYSKGARRMFVDMRDKMSDMNAKAQENIAANRVVKAFAREEYEENRFDERSRAFRDANLDINKRWLSFYPFIEILANAMTLLTVFFGGYLMITDGMTAGELTIFTQLAWTLSVPMRQLGNLLNDWQRFITCSNKVMEIEVSRPEIVDSSCAVNHDHIEGAISFDHVSFAYPDDNVPVLRDVSFTIPAGKTAAVLGGTGSGKSTMMYLLQRLYTPTSGKITIGGVDIQQIDRKYLRAHVGLILQEPFLYSKSIRENVGITAPEQEAERIEHAADIASASGFITKADKGWETVVGERGVTLSGGQKQRIAIARTLLKDNNILIFDDSLSAVDTETDAQIRAALRHEQKDVTTLIISHRVTTLSQADLILVLENGQITQQGTHAELCSQPGLYQRINSIQNALEEELTQAKAAEGVN